MASGKRIESIDIVKGIAIFAVCWLHIAHNTGVVYFGPVVPFFMGTFMLLSAYFYKPGVGYFKRVKRRFFQVGVPFLLYSAICIVGYYLLLLICGNAPEPIEILKAYASNIIDNYAFQPIDVNQMLPEGGMTLALIALPCWFLSRIFFSELLFFAIADWALKSLKRLIPTIIALLSVSCVLNLFLPFHLPFQLENCFAIAGVMLAGAYAKQKDIIGYIDRGYKKLKYWGIAAAVLAAYLAVYPFESYGTFLESGSYGPYKGWSVFPWFVTVLVGTYLMLVLCTFINKIKPVSFVLKQLGNHSLIILSFHMLFAKIIATIFGFTISLEEIAGLSSYKLYPFLEFTNSFSKINDVYPLQRIATVIVSIVLCILLSLAIAFFKKKIANRNTEKRSSVK